MDVLPGMLQLDGTNKGGIGTIQALQARRLDVSAVLPRLL